MRAGERGITLLELVAAMAIFALVAVMGLQALSGALRARDTLTRIEGETAALARALTLLRRDLKAAAPLRFLPPDAAADAAEPAFLDLSAGDKGGTLAFTTAGQPVRRDLHAAGLSRVIWRLDAEAGRLSRQVWPVLRPADAAARAPAVVLLDGVTGLRVRAFAGPEEGWIAGWGADPDTPRPPLPRAVDLRLGTARHGPLRVMVAF